MDEEDISVDSFLSIQRKNSSRTKMMIEKLRRTVRETEREALQIRQETERLRKVTLETRSLLEKKHPRLLSKSSSIKHDQNYTSKRFSDIAGLLGQIDGKKLSSTRSLQDLLFRRRPSADETSECSSSSTSSVTSKEDSLSKSVSQTQCPRPSSPPSYEPKYRKKRDSQKELNKMILNTTLSASESNIPLEKKISVKNEEEEVKDVQVSVVNVGVDPDEILVLSEIEPVYAEIPSLREEKPCDSPAVDVGGRDSSSKESLQSRLESDGPLYSSESDDTPLQNSKEPKKSNNPPLSSSTEEEESYKRRFSRSSSNFNSKFNLKHKPLNESDAEFRKEEAVSGPEDDDLINDDDFWN